jgi:hypothetical protein
MTEYSNRKATIRARMAAYPGLTYTAAARVTDAPDIAVVLAQLSPTPMVALASALHAVGCTEDSENLACFLIAAQTPDPLADQLSLATTRAYDAMVNPVGSLSRRQRDALVDAFEQAQDVEAAHLRKTGNWDDPYADEILCVRAIATALRHAASVADGATVARAAAAVLETWSFQHTADAIRNRVSIEPVHHIAAGALAQHAAAALHALMAAAALPFTGDEEWLACIGLLEKARRLAWAAAGIEADVRPNGHGF